MASIKFKGLEEYVRKLENLESYVETDLGQVIYEGADVVADAVKNALEQLPVDNRPANVKERSSINEYQKQGLIASFGIAKLMNDNGYRNVKLGFDGYNGIKSKKHPKGQPNAMIARSLESGTSFMPKQRTISKAVNKSKTECEKKMQECLDKKIEERMK